MNSPPVNPHHPHNPHKGRTGIDRVLRAFGYSLQGMVAALRGESAFRQEMALAVVMLPAAFWLGRSWEIGRASCRERV